MLIASIVQLRKVFRLDPLRSKYTSVPKFEPCRHGERTLHPFDMLDHFWRFRNFSFFLQACFTCPGQATVGMIERFGKFARAAHPVRALGLLYCVGWNSLHVRALLAKCLFTLRCFPAGIQPSDSVLW